MPDDLYGRDALAWSEHQAALSRCVARGDCVSGVDREHVIDEIETVGPRELHGAHSRLRLILVMSLSG
jgi:hypothetical protein